MCAWDGKMKQLVQVAQEDFVKWLVKGGRFEGELSPNFATRDRDGDTLWQISIDRMPSLFHLEFQLKAEANMGRRMWEYNVDAAIKYQQPVKSGVVYLTKPGHPDAAPPYQLKLPNGEVMHTFWFTVIELCKIPTKRLFQAGLTGILPLVPLTQEGQDHSAIEEVIKELRQPHVKRQEELLALTYGLAGLVFKGDREQKWLERKFPMIDDIVEESWTLQRVIQRGLERGREEEREESRKQMQQVLQMQKQNLLLLIQKHFSALLSLAQSVCDAVQTLDELQVLFQKLLVARSELEAREHLLAAQK
jgi:predicted transposase YdaD